VRELENIVERAVVVARADVIRREDLGPSLANSDDGSGGEARVPIVPGATMAELERYAILRTLEHTGGSTSRAADLLGISTRTIQVRLQEYQTIDEAGPDKNPGDKGVL
jgi:DNA-binding NtrC family response regulator